MEQDFHNMTEPNALNALGALGSTYYELLFAAKLPKQNLTYMLPQT